MAIIGIVAIDQNGAIGKGGKLPWHYPGDLKFFRKQTTGNSCVMGYRTWLTLKEPLKDRLNIVLSRSKEIGSQPGVIGLKDKLSVLSVVPYLSCNLFVIGGASIYEAFLDEIDQWIVTRVPLAVAGADAFVPRGFLNGFTAERSEDLGEGLVATFYYRGR